MGDDAAYRIEALTPQTWPAFEALVARHNGIFGGCWCTWFHGGHPSCEGRGETAEGNRAIKKRLSWGGSRSGQESRSANEVSGRSVALMDLSWAI